MELVILYDNVFQVERIEKKWNVSTLKYHLKVSEGKTKKEALLNAELEINEHGGKEGIEEAFKKKTKSRIETRFFNDKRIQVIFESIFKTSLVRFTDPIMYGFCYTKRINILSFDKFLRVPDQKNMNDFILEKYGNKALKLVKKLM